MDQLSSLSDLDLANIIAQTQQMMNQYPALIQELDRRNELKSVDKSVEKPVISKMETTAK